MLGRMRFSIGGLMAGVALAAIGLWAFRTGTEAAFRTFYTLTIGVLLVATLAAWLGPEGRRAFWIGFALFGWAGLLLGFGIKVERPNVEDISEGKNLVGEMLLTTPYLKQSHNLMNVGDRVEAIGKYGYSLASGHLLVTLGLALIGGGIGLWFGAQSPAVDNVPARVVAAPARSRSSPRLRMAAALAALLVALTVLFSERSGGGPDFPSAAAFGAENTLNDSAARYFSAYLTRMNEPPVWKLARSGRGDAAFRLVWPPTFGHPLAVRVEKRGDQITLRAVILDGHGGYERGVIAFDRRWTLTPDQWKELIRRADAAGFWTMPVRDKVLDGPGGIDDGYLILLEGVSPSRYHAVYRVTADDEKDPFGDLCKFILKLARIDPERLWHQ